MWWWWGDDGGTPGACAHPLASPLRAEGVQGGRAGDDGTTARPRAFHSQSPDACEPATATSLHRSVSLCRRVTTKTPLSRSLLFFPSLSPSFLRPLAPTEARRCVGPRREGRHSPWHPGPRSSWLRPGERGQPGVPAGRGGAAPHSARGGEGWHQGRLPGGGDSEPVLENPGQLASKRGESEQKGQGRRLLGCRGGRRRGAWPERPQARGCRQGGQGPCILGP